MVIHGYISPIRPYPLHSPVNFFVTRGWLSSKALTGRQAVLSQVQDPKLQKRLLRVRAAKGGTSLEAIESHYSCFRNLDEFGGLLLVLPINFLICIEDLFDVILGFGLECLFL